MSQLGIAIFSDIQFEMVFNFGMPVERGAADFIRSNNQICTARTLVPWSGCCPPRVSALPDISELGVGAPGPACGIRLSLGGLSITHSRETRPK
jgi:hypothetical protein